MASGSLEQLVGDDHVTTANQWGSSPSVLLVDPRSTRIRGALTATSDGVVYTAAPELPAQSSPTLRVYAAERGQLYSIEGGATGGSGTLTVVGRDVAMALAGSPTATSHAITGDLPNDPQAMVWISTRSRLLVLDRAPYGTSFWRVRLLSVDPATGQSTMLWQTQEMDGTQLPAQTFLSMDGFGQAVLSLSFAEGMYEAVTVRSDDGQPLRSVQGSGSLHDAVTSDGAGFTVPLDQPPTEQQANVDIQFVPATAIGVGLCGTRWLRDHTGDQGTMALGNPAQDCQ